MLTINRKCEAENNRLLFYTAAATLAVPVAAAAVIPAVFVGPLAVAWPFFTMAYLAYRMENNKEKLALCVN